MAYLSLADWASAVFSEQAAGTLAEAKAVFESSQGPDRRAKANGQALAAWLNWANGRGRVGGGFGH